MVMMMITMKNMMLMTVMMMMKMMMMTMMMMTLTMLAAKMKISFVLCFDRYALTSSSNDVYNNENHHVENEYDYQDNNDDEDCFCPMF